MALRKVSEYVFVCGSEDMQPEPLDKTNPDVILRLDPRVPTIWAKDTRVVDVFTTDEDAPDAKTIKAWLEATLPVIASEKNVLIVSHVGNNRACTVGALVKCIVEKKRLNDVYQELHDLFLTQGYFGHNWWPYQHWRDAINKHWKSAVQPFQTLKSAEPVPSSTEATTITLDDVSKPARVPPRKRAPR